jgi:hypothetical protein
MSLTFPPAPAPAAATGRNVEAIAAEISYRNFSANW